MTNSSPFLFFNSITFERVPVAELNSSLDNMALYFDAHNGDRVSGGFQNFLAYLIANKVGHMRVCVIKDVFSYTG
jgi:hypothetical protein